MLSSDLHYPEMIQMVRDKPHKQVVLFACDVVRHVIQVWERRMPFFAETKKSIITLEKYAIGQAKIEEAKIATNSAWKESNIRIANDNSTNALNAAWTIIHSTGSTVELVVGILNAVRGASPTAKRDNIDLWEITNLIFNQLNQCCTIPVTCELQAIARSISESRNFNEYNVLLDNLEEFHTIVLPREMPLGLSHWVLSQLLVQQS